MGAAEGFLGRIQFRLTDLSVMCSLYKESVRLFGPHFITFYNIALCYNETGRQELALQHFDQAIALNGEYQPAVAARAEILLQRKRATEAASTTNGTVPHAVN